MRDEMIPWSSGGNRFLGTRLNARGSRALAHLEERTILRSAEIQGLAIVGQTAERAIAEVTICEEELAKLSPPGARLRMAAVGDAVTAAIQARILELMEGL
jgi:hypothetical protein